MVKINRSSRHFAKSAATSHTYVTRHFFQLIMVSSVAVIVALYVYLLGFEERSEEHSGSKHDAPVILHMAAAVPVERILETRKPFLVYGTAWKEDETAKYVQQAVMSGFRFIDTACQPKHYNEPGVGAGWTAAAVELGLQRSDLYLQTKFTAIRGQDPKRIPYDPDAPLTEQVKQSLDASLDNLRTDYLDSLVLHSPLKKFEDTMRVWQQMEEFVDQGKVHRLGISNCYDYEMFTKLYEQARIKPAILQNRFYSDSNFDTELRQFCKEHNIWYQSFWTLTANRHALGKSAVKEWAAKVQLTPQTLLYAFLMSLGYATPLDGTTSVKHMAEDVAVMERLQNGEKIFKGEDELRQFAKLLGMPDL